MTLGTRRGLLIAAIHVAIVCSLGAKLLVDRATRPRVWARVAPYDPNLPIRGRYVSLQIEGTLEGIPASGSEDVTLAAQNGSLLFVPTQRTTGLTVLSRRRPDGTAVAVLTQPVAFFIPEHQVDPSVRARSEELWAEVTLPSHGPPRPIRLGVKKDGRLTPLE